MRTDKGYLKDPDRSTARHQEICLWFTEQKNAENFVRLFLGDLAFDLKTKLETPVRSKSGFLYGYADICISYRTDQSEQEHVLVEVKTSLTDFGAVLRQVRTYQEYLSGITKTCLVHCGLDEDIEEKATQYFVSQDIYVTSLQSIREEIEIALTEEPIKIPAGKREAQLCGVHCISGKSGDYWDLSFLVHYHDTFLGREISDVLSTGNYFDHKAVFWEIIRKFGLHMNREHPATIWEGEINIPCYVEVTYKPAQTGYPEAVLDRVHIKGEIIDLIK